MPTDESLPKLTPNQINVLVVLMAEARELDNNELKELAGLALTGADNAKLVKLGFVITDRTHRPFSHQLDDAGARFVRELHTAEPPKAGGSAARTLFTLLKNVQRGLAQTSAKSYGDFFSRSTTGPASAASLEEQIRAAYRELAKAPGDWVALADLREKLTDVDRDSLDDALRAMLGEEGVRIIPVANTKALQPRDRAAALRIGDEDNHALAIGAE